MKMIKPKSNFNWHYRETITQAFAGGSQNAFQTMLRMAASRIPGGVGKQNEYIAIITQSSVRSVRRWRNQGTVPHGYPNQSRVFDSLYHYIIDNRKYDFYPIGFRFLIEVWGKEAFSYSELYDLYEQRLLGKFRNAAPFQLTILKKQVEKAVIDATGSGSGSVALRFEHAPDPDKVFEVETRRRTRKKKKMEEKTYTYPETGYMDFFNPYDLPMMTTKIAAALEAASNSITMSQIKSALTDLRTELRYWYGFYEPKVSKRPHSKMDPTADYMRWLEKVIELAEEG